MNVPVMAVLPTAAWRQEGFDRESDKRRTTRAENRKRLQEMADSFAAQGKQLSFDEWERMVRDTVGDDGLLYGYAPTGDAVESIRSAANAKATGVAEEQRAKQFVTDQREMESVEGAVIRRIQSGDNEAQVGAWLQQNYPKQAAEIVGRLPKIKGELELKETQAGVTLAARYNTRAEAEQELSRNPAITKAMRESALRALDVKESQLKQGLIDKAMSLGERGGADNPEVMNAIRAYIRSVPALAAMPDAEEVARNAVQGAWKMKRTTAEAGLRDKQREVDITQGWDVTKFGVGLDIQEQERRRLLSKEYVSQFSPESNPGVASVQKVLSKEFKASKDQKELATRALDFLAQNYVRDPDEIIKAVQDGDEAKFGAAIKSALTYSVPFSARREQAAAIADIINGGVSDYNQAAKAVLRPEIAQRGRAYAQETQVVNKSGIESAFVRDAVDGIVALREGLQRGGAFNATAAELDQRETELVRRIAEQYAGSAGVDAGTIARKIVSQLPMPTGIIGRPTGSQIVNRVTAARATDSNLNPDTSRIPIPGGREAPAAGTGPGREVVDLNDPATRRGRLQILEEEMQKALASGNARDAESIAAEMRRLGVTPPRIPAAPQAAAAPAAAPAARPTPSRPSGSISDAELMASLKKVGPSGIVDHLLGPRPSVRNYSARQQWDAAAEDLRARMQAVMRQGMGFR